MSAGLCSLIILVIPFIVLLWFYGGSVTMVVFEFFF